MNRPGRELVMVAGTDPTGYGATIAGHGSLSVEFDQFGGHAEFEGELAVSVDVHLNVIFGKLDAHTRTEAVTRAARLGVITL